MPARTVLLTADALGCFTKTSTNFSAEIIKDDIGSFLFQGKSIR